MKNSILYMILSILSISLSGFFAKISIANLSVVVTVFSRFAVPLILIGCYSVFDNSNLVTPSLESTKRSIVRASALTVSQLSLYIALRGLSLGEATLLYNTGPLFIVIFSLFKGYRLSISTTASLALGAIGVLVTFAGNTLIMNQYMIFGLISGVAFAISQISLQKSSKNDSVLNIMFHLYALTSAISLFVLTVSGNFYKDLMKVDINSILILIFIGLTSFSNQFFRGLSYKNCINPSKLAPLIYLSIPLSAILDTLYYRTRIDSNSILGMSLILIASLIATTRLPTALLVSRSTINESSAIIPP